MSDRLVSPEMSTAGYFSFQQMSLNVIGIKINTPGAHIYELKYKSIVWLAKVKCRFLPNTDDYDKNKWWKSEFRICVMNIHSPLIFSNFLEKGFLH